MPLFQKKENSILGVDVGTSSIKMVELAKNKDGTHTLVNYAFAENIHREEKGKTRKEEAARLGGYIKALREKTKFTTSTATAALPTYSVFVSLVSFPPVAPSELDAAIHWEAKKIIPLPLEDIILDYRILNQPEKKGFSLSLGKKEEKEKKKKEMKVLITGAARETVERYSEVFQESGLTLTSLETEMFALARSLVGTEIGEIMIVEIGSSLTDIMVVENGIPFIGRSIEVGGDAMTRAIMASLNINEKRAEQVKRDVGILTAGAEGGGIPDILKSALEPILHEIRYTLDLYKNHQITPSGFTTGTIEKIILTGGAALLPHLAEYFAKELDIRVYLGDPWARITYQEDLRPILTSIGSKFSVAIGLALREEKE